MSGLASQTPERRLASLLEAFARHLRDALAAPDDHPGPWHSARRFLESQGFDPLRMDRLPLGLLVDCQRARSALKEAGFSPAEIEASELTSDTRLDGRLVGPIRNQDGVIRSFWARHPDGRRPQYLFKGAWRDEIPAFGLDLALPALEEQRPLVLIEGLLDVVLIQSLGFLPIAGIAGPVSDLDRLRWQRLGELGVRRVILLVRANGPEERQAVLDTAARARSAPEAVFLPWERLEGRLGAGDFARARGIAAFRGLFESRPEPFPVPVEPDASCEVPRDGVVPDFVEKEALEGLEVPIQPGEPLPPPPRPRRGFCELHACEETECFCFD